MEIITTDANTTHPEDRVNLEWELEMAERSTRVLLACWLFWKRQVRLSDNRCKGAVSLPPWLFCYLMSWLYENTRAYLLVYKSIHQKSLPKIWNLQPTNAGCQVHYFCPAYIFPFLFTWHQVILGWNTNLHMLDILPGGGWYNYLKDVAKNGL